MYYEDYEEYYADPSEADAIIDEAKEKLNALLTEEVKQTMEQAKAAQKSLEKIQREIRESEYKLGNLKLEHQREEEKWETIDQYRMPRQYIKQLVEAVAGDFVPGDTVYALAVDFQNEECPLCHGSKEVECKIADSQEVLSIKCPTCNGRGCLAKRIDYVKERKVSGIYMKLCFDEDGVRYWSKDCVYLDNRDSSTDIKNIFHTKEEAEKALAERKKVG